MPSRKAGTAFVLAQANLFLAYGEGSAMESIALCAAMLMPILLLQKPYARSRTKQHMTCLERCLILWKAGDIDALVEECCSIQRQFRRSSVQRTSNEQHMMKEFSKFMSQSKVKAAVQLLDNHHNGGPLPLDDAIQSGIVQTTVREGLIAKHPQGQPPHPETVLCLSLLVQEPHPTLLLDGELIHSVAL